MSIFDSLFAGIDVAMLCAIAYGKETQVHFVNTRRMEQTGEERNDSQPLPNMPNIAASSGVDELP